jgi:hypothetical protein
MSEAKKKIKEWDVILADGGETKKSKGKLRIQHWDQQERIARAFKWFGLFFGLAIVCIFIPLLHFILVPSFLIATPIVTFFI